jgi:aspartyl-tRNA(Asn)/glutamyl-tRNA(Gln) amidotransferase subunit A
MDALPPDPLDADGIIGFGRRLRSGKTSIESATRSYLARIHALDRLSAYEYVAAEAAVLRAQELDQLLRAGEDLGPLMGLPIAIKDNIGVAGMPCSVGSNVDLSGLLPEEGSFVAALKKAGCIILGKARTVEFALGSATTFRGTPWNVWAADVHRSPGGSSSGSAVAVAGGLCAFAIGTDTGGSVRVPAAFCGLFGLKTSLGLWPLDGVFPLSSSLDALGLLTKTAADAAVIYTALTGEAVPTRSAKGLRLGLVRPSSEELGSPVSKSMRAAVEELTGQGIEIVPVDIPEFEEAITKFRDVSPVELLATLGRERFLSHRDEMDPAVASRLASVMDIPAYAYIETVRSQPELARRVAERIEGLDGVIGTTTFVTVPSVDDLETPAFRKWYDGVIIRNTRPVNVLDLCAASIPMRPLAGALPEGLQVICRGREDGGLLSLASLLEQLIGDTRKPDLAPFLGPA